MGITERTAEAERVELLSLRARVAELEQAIKVQASAVRSLDASRALRDAFETRTLRSLAGQERADLLRQIDAVREEATTWNARATELEAALAGRTTTQADPPPRCTVTHHTGCACHEARRDAEAAALRAQIQRIRAAVADLPRHLGASWWGQQLSRAIGGEHE